MSLNSVVVNDGAAKSSDVSQSNAVTTIVTEFVHIKSECEMSIKQEVDDTETIQTPASTVGPDGSTFPFEVHVKAEVEASQRSPPSSPPRQISYHPFRFDVDVKTEPVDYIPFQDDPDLSEMALNTGDSYDIPHTSYSHEILTGKTSNRKHSCPICNKCFASTSNVQRHLILHSRKKVQCGVCKKEYLTEEQVKKHMDKRHNQVRKYPCIECQKVFKSAANLNQHKRMHLSIKPFKCENCQRAFSVKANLLRHLQAKNRCKLPVKKPLKCHVCNKEFHKEFLLKSHLRRHDTEKPFFCDYCQMNFKYKSTLIRHIQIHNGLKPYSCSVCDKTFTHSGLIKPHMRTHTGEKPYKCTFCSKYFAHKHNMQRHALRHSIIKNLVCDICNKKFPKESRLKYHMKIHVDQKHFSCYVCPKKFSHRQNILRHYTRKHPGATYDCKETDASVATKVWEAVAKKELVLKGYESPEEILG